MTRQSADETEDPDDEVQMLTRRKTRMTRRTDDEAAEEPDDEADADETEEAEESEEEKSESEEKESGRRTFCRKQKILHLSLKGRSKKSNEKKSYLDFATAVIYNYLNFMKILNWEQLLLILS